MSKFSSWAKLREIVRLLSEYRLRNTGELMARLLTDAQQDRSNSPFRRPAANDSGSASFLALERDTILAHVRFAEKIGIAVYRDESEQYLPGFEPQPFDFSAENMDRTIFVFLEKNGISRRVIEQAIDAIEFHDVDSIIEVLRQDRRLPLSEEEFRKCLRLLGECDITLSASRKKTYAIKGRRRM